MRIENRRAIFETVLCWNCEGKGLETLHNLCPKRELKIRRTGCNVCHSPKGSWDHQTIGTRQEKCHVCDGNGSYMETSTDYDKSFICRLLPIEVIRSEHPQTFNEAYLGLGYFYCVTDYGRHKRASDAELIDEFMKHSPQQYCKFVKDDGRLADKIQIICNNAGYAVKAYFAPIGEDICA